MAKQKSRESILEDTLFKKAIGYTQDEVIEEYVPDSENTDEFKILKRKITKKIIPPDITAAKVLLEYFLAKKNVNYESLDDEMLSKERIRLLQELENLEENKGEEIINEQD